MPEDSRHNFSDPASVPRVNRFGQTRLGDTTDSLPDCTEIVTGENGQPTILLPSWQDHPSFQALIAQQQPAADSKFLPQDKLNEEPLEELPKLVINTQDFKNGSASVALNDEKAIKLCTSCGFQLPVEAKYCMDCGAKQPIRFCVSCGNEFGDNHKFCAICGHKR